MIVAIIVLGIVLIVACVFLILSHSRSQVLASQLADRSSRLAAAENDALRLRDETGKLSAGLAAAEQSLKDKDERLKSSKEIEDHWKKFFSGLASDVLVERSGDLTRQTKDAVSAITDPLAMRLSDLTKDVNTLKGSADALHSSANNLAAETTFLAAMLRGSEGQGEWGEQTLKRLVSLAGMEEHVDWVEKPRLGESIPDLEVRLTNGGKLYVDSKTTIRHFQSAEKAQSADERNSHLEQNAEHVRDRIRELVKRAYWKKYENSPECVVMFVPSEPGLAAAFRTDPGLFDSALRDRVLIASPITLLALLKAFSFGWQQVQLADHANEIQHLAQELIDRLTPFVNDHLLPMGQALKKVVKEWEDGVGSYEKRVWPQAQRIRELGIGKEDLKELPRVDLPPRLRLVGESTGSGEQLGADGEAPAAS